MSHCKILKEGDKNTRYFHLIASIRRRKKLLERISTQGKVVSDQSLIRQAIVDHFKELYAKQPVTQFDITNLGLPRLSSYQS